jgi:hypothetical protein
MAISRTSAHFEQNVYDIVCVECVIEVYLIFKIFYKDNNKYSRKQENQKKNLSYFFFIYASIRQTRIFIDDQ